MAHDNFAYVGAYRKCIDEIAQYKKDVWSLVLNSKTDYSFRIQAWKELHSLSKTYTLLIKDIQFVTNLTKYYDLDILDSNYKNSSYNSSYSNNLNNINTTNQNINEINYNTIKSLNDQFSIDDIKNSHITDTINSQNRFENHKEKFEKAILVQLKYNADTSISKEHLEYIKRSEGLEYWKNFSFLWFDNQDDEASNYYVSIFKNSKLNQVSYYGDAWPGPKDSVMTLTFWTRRTRICCIKWWDYKIHRINIFCGKLQYPTRSRWKLGKIIYRRSKNTVRPVER